MQKNNQTQAGQDMTLAQYMQYIQMMNMHYQNHYKMLRCYTGLRPINTMFASPRLEPDDYDEEGVPMWQIGSCTLTVVPFGMTDHPYRWVVLDTPAPVFQAPLNKTIIYLSLPLTYPTRSAELTLQDEVYWIIGCTVMAAGVVEHVIIEDVIVTEEALIIPVIVTPFVHRFSPFNMRDAGYGENIEEYDAFEAEHVTPCFGRQMPLSSIPPERVPPVAIELDGVIAMDLLNYIDNDYHSGLRQASTLST
jgi:hypothetical protein